ncbi:MAG: S-layer homology domain-containing protein [Cyanobacteria bacterium J06633_2]
MNKRSVSLMAIALAWVVAPACADGNLGESLQRLVEADPRLAQNGEQDEVLDVCPDDVLAQLPNNFPSDLCFPGAELIDLSETSQGTVISTEWMTSASMSDVQAYYQNYLEGEAWEVTNSVAVDDRQTLEAVNQGDRLVIQLEETLAPADPSDEVGDRDDTETPLSESLSQTEFSVQLQLDENDTALSADADENSTESDQLTPEDARLFSQIDPDASDTESPTRSAIEPSRSQQRRSPSSFIDLDQAPEELQRYIDDLSALGILASPQEELGDSDANTRSDRSRNEFNPNDSITRQEYAEWLLTANNVFYGDRPSRNIRLATSSSTPVFQDVSSSDSAYAAIQGLANAGLIPSSLSGDTAVNFRPTAALTREDLIRWKVPLDRRGSLPSTTLSAVEEAWGFQDVAQINPAVLPMVFADYQNGDQANILRAFGYTTLFQPQKAVTRAEAAAALWHFGYQADGISADALQTD